MLCNRQCCGLLLCKSFGINHLALKNRLLSSLPADTAQRLLQAADEVALDRGAILHEPYEHPRFAYFPVSGVCSVVTRTSSGHAVETAMLGNEGCTGAAYLMGAAPVPSQYVQQIAGISIRIPFADLQAQYLHSDCVRDSILALIQVLHLSLGQLVACQGLHHAEQRLARWLLTARQRSRSDVLHLSHEFLAEMLGSGRPRVTLLLLEFREKGLVESERSGLIKIRDVAGLEATACECHGIISQLYASLYPMQAAGSPGLTFSA